MVDLLLAADFDGTLAPIRTSPAVVLPDPELVHFLCEAAELERVAVAIISGRDLEDLAHRVGALPAFLAGSHGLEIRDPSGFLLREAPPLSGEIDPRLERDIEAAGMRIERKKHGIALHWRGSGAADGTHPLVEEFRGWAGSRGLDNVEGRMVVEARIPGSGKEAALEFLAAHTGASRVVYAGDDFTDFAALKLAASRGRAIFFRSDERAAPPFAEQVSTRAELLALFEEELKEYADGETLTSHVS
jgi:trehalose 6-phosphate phosphatase